MSYRLYNVALDFYALARNFFGLRWVKDVMIGGWTARHAFFAGVIMLGGAALITAFIGVAARLFRKGAGGRAATWAAALFFPHAVFFTFRDAGNIDRWTIQAFAVVVFIYAVAAAAAGTRRFGRVVLFALPALLFVANFSGSIYPESKPENNEHLAYVDFVNGLTNPGDVVVASGFGGIGGGVYLTYFAGVKEASVFVGARNPESFERLLADAIAAGHDVYAADVRPAYASTDFVAPGVEEEYSVTGAVAAELFAGYERELVGTYRGPRYAPSRLWRLRPK
jgi:hypothetical protein